MTLSESQQTEEFLRQVHVRIVVYYTLLALGMVFCFIVPTWLFVRRRHLPSIRHRSTALTLFCSLTAALMYLHFFARAPISPWYPCWLLLWVPYLLVPIYGVALCARAFRLIGIYRVSEASAIIVRWRMQSDTADADECTEYNSRVETAACKSQEKLGTDASDTAEKGRGLLGVHNSQPARVAAHLKMDAHPLLLHRPNPPENVAHAPPKTMTRTEAERAALKSASIFLHNRWLLRTRTILWILAGVEAMMIVILAIAHFMSPRSGFTHVSHDFTDGCYVGWERLPLYIISGIIIAVVMPWLLWMLHTVRDTYGIRQEIIANMLGLMVGMVVHVLLTFTFSENFDFLPENALAISLAWNQIFCVGMPLWNVRRENNWARRAKPQGQANDAQLQGRNTRSAFRAFLNDSESFKKFNAFAVRGFSAENTMFYDACRRILKIMDAEVDGADPAEVPMHEMLHQMPPIKSFVSVAPNRQDRTVEVVYRHLLRLHDIFLANDADLEVNLTDS
ncbi:hypothetical protein THASP1DRAFT_33367, partial [Thamnocephalis sphaerospora]